MLAWLWRGGDDPTRIAHDIDRLPESTLEAAASAPGQRVRVSGRLAAVDGAAALHAPISGAPCLWWRVVVERGDARRVVIDERGGQDFLLLAGGSGPKALVRIAGARIAARADAQTLYGLVGDGPKGFEELLVRHQFRRRGRPTLHYHEHRLEVGDAVVVVGHATPEPDPDPAAARAYRAHATRVVLAGSRKLPVLLRDAAVWR